MSYTRAKAEATGKVRSLRLTAHEIVDIAALKYGLTEKQRLRLREEIVSRLISGNNQT